MRGQKNRKKKNKNFQMDEIKEINILIFKQDIPPNLLNQSVIKDDAFVFKESIHICLHNVDKQGRQATTKAMVSQIEVMYI